MPIMTLSHKALKDLPLTKSPWKSNLRNFAMDGGQSDAHSWTHLSSYEPKRLTVNALTPSDLVRKKHNTKMVNALTLSDLVRKTANNA